MKNRNKPSPTTPLGIKFSKNPSRAELVKVTDNTKGWTKIDNIPVPPVAEKRNFDKPLGQNPFLMNGGTINTYANKPEVVVVSETNPSFSKGPGETLVSPGSSFTYSESFSSKIETKPIKTQTMEIMWHGSKMAVECMNVVHQLPNLERGIEGWLMLELIISEKTKTPAWIPPVARLEEHGKIYVPEFDCKIQNKLFKCQVLNIDITDLLNEKRVFVFRVLDFTEYMDDF